MAALNKAVHDRTSPPLHSGATRSVECPSGPSQGKFLMSTLGSLLYLITFLFIDPSALCRGLGKRTLET